MPTSSHTVESIAQVEPGEIPMSVYTSDVPIVLRGLVRHWELVEISLNSSSALVEKLKSYYSGKPAPVYFGKTEGETRLAYNSDVSELNFEIRRAPIDHMLDELQAHINGDPLSLRYIASNAIDVFFPALRNHNDLSFDSPHFDDNPLEASDPLAGIWIGNKTTSPCHYDAQHNIACCVAGKRQFTLFPPDQIKNLYPGPLDLNPGGPAITMVDLDKPDPEKYPRYETAAESALVAELEPGDAIYIPCMWWHQVAALSNFNVLINYWWNTFPKIMGQAMTVLEHALLSLRDRPAAEKEAWRHIFNYYVFDDSEHAGAHLPEAARGALGPIDDTLARQLRAKLIRKLNR